MGQNAGLPDIPQYSLRKILLVWAAAAVPMGILGWFVAPALTPADPRNALTVRLAVLMVGLVWQFILVMLLLYQEAGNLRWSTIRTRLWLTRPRSPQTGELRSRLWWWLVPLIMLAVVYGLLISGLVDRLWLTLFPFFTEPAGFSMRDAVATPQAKADLVGAWGLWVLFLVNAVFNTFIGEELLFRGLLLPRMAGVFGKWDWVVNGLIFGFYHLHQPWGILDSVVEGTFLLALPSRYFRSAWFGIIAHSGQSIFFAYILLGLVLGLG
jgi:uncharacterized protein